MRIQVTAPAKINLTLDITGMRDDGYHLLEMVMQSVDLCDTVTINDDGPNGEIVVIGGDGIPDGKDNIAYAAAKVFFDFTEQTNAGVTIRIKKRIPVAAGLGGGSADAAAVLLGLNHLYETHLSPEMLVEPAVLVGADVPFCLTGGTAFVEGVGGLLNPLPSIPDCWFLFVKPWDKQSTREMYRRFDENPERFLRNRPDNQRMVDAICEGQLEEIARSVGNVFEGLWESADLQKIKDEMRDFGALGTSLSGSGPTVFGVFENRAAADKCAATLRRDWDGVFLCQPRSTGCEIEN